MLLAAMLVLVAGCSRGPAPAQLGGTPNSDTIATPPPIQSGVTILADGVVQPAQPVLPLAFDFGGKLLELYVRAGDEVREGEVLATLEEAQSLDDAVKAAELLVLKTQQSLDAVYSSASMMTAQAQMNLAVAQDELKDAERTWQYQQEGYRASGTTIKAAEAELAIAAQRLEDARSKYDSTPGSRTEDPQKAQAYKDLAAAEQRYQSALASLNWYTGHPTEIDQALLDAVIATAQAQLEEAKRQWDARKDGPDSDELALAEAELANARAQLTQAIAAQEGVTLAAPMDGTVLSVEAAPGALVGGGFPVLTLLDTSQLEFHTTNLTERDLALIIPGQTAMITLKAYPNEPIEAAVVRIGWQAGAAVGDAVTFPVMLALSETDLAVRSGMTGRAEIRIEE